MASNRDKTVWGKAFKRVGGEDGAVVAIGKVMERAGAVRLCDTSGSAPQDWHKDGFSLDGEMYG